MTQYELLQRMGYSQQPVDNLCNSWYPRYVGYYTGCESKSSQRICEKTIANLTDDELTTLLQEFVNTYPELAVSLHDNGGSGGLAYHLTKVKNIGCLYPQYTCLDSQCEKLKFFLLLAHILTLDKDPAYRQNTISSASVGDASTSFDTSYTNKLNNNPFFLWLSKTKYGNELLTLIRMNSGVVVV